MGNKINPGEIVTVKHEKRVKPDWLKTSIPGGDTYVQMLKLVNENKLHTICQSGKCPNMGECWGAGTATFMILGNTCTRSCQFCNVATGKGEQVDALEPFKVAQSISIMGIRHAVITSVDRDDLKDGGSEHWARTIRTIREFNPGTTLETLIPDFGGNEEQIQRIIDEAPEIVSHNLETVERLTRQVRVQAKYERSLGVLRYLSSNGMQTKSGMMLGMGETEAEILEAMDDLLEHGVQILTLGQYMQPTQAHLTVAEYIHPDQFARLKVIALEKGFEYVESGPLVRSSYHAEKHLK